MKSLRLILREACGEDRIEDTVKGGLADEMDPSEFDQKELMKGVHVEKEHTDDLLQAMEIAMDHLSEDPDYYIKLATIESKSLAGEDESMAGEGDAEQLAAFEAEFERDGAGLESGRKNKNLKRTWQRLWRGKQ